MSRHGPPGEPYPRGEEFGPPSDPWRRGERYPPGDYRPGGQEPGGYEPGGYDPGGYEPGGYEGGYEPGPYQPGHRPDPGYDPDPRYDPDPGYRSDRYQPDEFGEPDYPADDLLPPPRRPTGLYALAAVLVVLAAVGVGYALYLLTSADGEPPADPGSVAPGEASGTDGPAGDGDNLGMNAAMARPEDCLVNDGSAEIPQLRIVACDSPEEEVPLFQVLAIFDERVEGDDANQQAQSICAETEGYTHHYYEVSDSASFVLCMAAVAPPDDADSGEAEDEAEDD